MELSRSEAAVLALYHEKTRIAGGAKPGYLLRLESIRRLGERTPGVEVEQGLAGLAEKSLLQPTEKGDRYYLTESGVERLQALPPAS